MESNQDNNAMHKLFLGISKIMPEEMLIERIEEALSDYKKDGSAENRSTLKMYVVMFSMRLMTEKDSLSETLSEYDEHTKMVDRNKILNT